MQHGFRWVYGNSTLSAVYLILLFLRVPAPTAELKTAKILFSNPHTSTSPITGDQLTPYTWKPLIMLSVVCASMMIGRVTAVYGMRTSWVQRFAKLKPREYYFYVFWSQCAKSFIVPAKISTYTVYFM